MIYSAPAKAMFSTVLTIAVEAMITHWTMNMTRFEGGRRHVAA